MTTLYVLDVPENTGVAKAAAQDPAQSVGRVGPYFEITASGPITIDRRATGCRHAVWYSAVAGVPATAASPSTTRTPCAWSPHEHHPGPSGSAPEGTSPPGAARNPPSPRSTS